MPRAARTSEQIAQRLADDTFRFVLPTPEEVQAGVERQLRLNTVLGNGCGLCTLNRFHTSSHHLSREDGGRIACPLLLEGTPRILGAAPLTEEEQARCATCSIPQLYADVHDNLVQQVSEAEIASARPF